MAFESGLELGVRVGGLVGGLVPKSGWSWAEPELGRHRVGAELEVGRHTRTRIQDSGIVRDAPKL